MRRQQGFTLMELLIALTLISVMMVLLFGGLRLGSRSWDRVDQHLEQTSEMRLVWKLLQKSLDEFRPLTSESEREKSLVFAGTAKAVEFVTPMSKHAGLGGLSLVRFGLRQSEKGHALTVRRWLYHPEVLAGGGDAPVWDPLPEGDDQGQLSIEQRGGTYGEHLLVDNVTQFYVRYYGKQKGAKKPKWHNKWPRSLDSPELVRIRIQVDGEWWPDMMARLPEPSLVGFTPFGFGAR